MNTSYVDTAARIGARLARDASWDGERCNWFSPVMEQFSGELKQGIGTLGPCIYDGTAGIGLFLGQLYLATQDVVFAQTATGAIEHALSRSEDIPGPVALGFYTGCFGVGFAAVQVGRWVRRADLIERGLALVRQATELGTDGRFVLDVMSGYAGTVRPLLSLHESAGHQWLLDAAEHAGAELLARAQASERGTSWDTTSELAAMVGLMDIPDSMATGLKPSGNRPHLTGLSHGSAGIAWALLELGVATGNARMMEAAKAGMAYEDSWFDARLDQWCDLRHEHPGQTGSGAADVAWCHGASGIGLTRLRAWELTGDPGYRKAVQAALRITFRSVASSMAGTNNYSLCHGLAGDAELFIKAAAMGEPGYGPVVQAIAQHGQVQYGHPERQWPSGAEDRQEAPGLMLGMAGTGYFYLRAADPVNTPSMLLVTR
jgi:lantibiotic modifying enzyme